MTTLELVNKVGEKRNLSKNEIKEVYHLLFEEECSELELAMKLFGRSEGFQETINQVLNHLGIISKLEKAKDILEKAKKFHGEGEIQEDLYYLGVETESVPEGTNADTEHAINNYLQFLVCLDYANEENSQATCK